MDKELYEKIKKAHGKHASWAIWGTPLEDLYDYEKIKGKIKPNIVMVGLNISSEVSLDSVPDFENFHFPEDEEKMRKMHWISKKNLEKLIYTFKGEVFEGAYMTDIIKPDTIEKGIELSNSKEVMDYLKKHLEVERENIEIFKEELKLLEFTSSENPLIIAFGDDACEILSRNIKQKHFEGFNFGIIKVKSYTYNRNRFDDKDVYKKDVWGEINIFQTFHSMKTS